MMWGGPDVVRGLLLQCGSGARVAPRRRQAAQLVQLLGIGAGREPGEKPISVWREPERSSPALLAGFAGSVVQGEMPPQAAN